MLLAMTLCILSVTEHTQEPRHKTQDMRPKTQNPCGRESGVWGLESGVWCLGSGFMPYAVILLLAQAFSAPPKAGLIEADGAGQVVRRA